MNTIPDDELLALWVEDELSGPSAASVDAWASAQPEWLEHREMARQMKPLLRANVPASEEPPYAEFFNARIAREIGREVAAVAVAPAGAPPAKFWRWFLPATAVAGMAMCFWMGTWVGPTRTTVVEGPAPAPTAPGPYLYTPEKGVKAAYFASEPADAMVIVLDGVAAIPDTFEVPDTASSVIGPEKATADLGLPTP